jgi:hypothetical protein
VDQFENGEWITLAVAGITVRGPDVRVPPTGQADELLAEGSVGRRATRRRSIEPGRIQALRRIVNGSAADGVLARHRSARPNSDDPGVTSWV